MNIPMDVIEQIPAVQQEHVNNLLVLALSTFPYSGKMSETVYSCPLEKRNLDRREDGDRKILERVSGIYQLDPIPAYLKSVVGLDGVLMIKSKETTEPRTITITRKDKEGNDVQEEPRTISPENYFRETITGLATTDHPIEIQDCDLSEGDVAKQSDIDRVIDEIRKYCQRHSGEKVRIYLDLHGGPRANAQIMTAIISLLPLETTKNTLATGNIHIYPEDIYSVIFDGNQSESNRIVCAGDSYDIMDLVAGVHEFVEYGRTESLNNYKERHTEIADMVGSMDTISEALAMADIQMFHDGLKNLKGSIKELEARMSPAAAEQDQEQEGPEVSRLLLNLVQQEYREIIETNDQWIGYIRKIDWCLDKKFYQLALTMCEAQIPWALQKRHVLNMSAAVQNGYGQFNWMKEESEKFLGAFNYFLTNYHRKARQNKVYYQMKWRTPTAGDGKYYYLECERGNSNAIDQFLGLHANIKETRNTANHLLSYAENQRTKAGRTIRVYQNSTELNNAIRDYLRITNELVENGVRLEMKVTDHPLW